MKWFTGSGERKIKLGDYVKDRVSGYEGTVVAEHVYLHGCMRMTVQPNVDKDGKLPEAETFDEPQLQVQQPAAVQEGDHAQGGPEKYPDKGRR